MTVGRQGGPSTAVGPGTAALQVTEAAADARSELASVRPVVFFLDGWRNVLVLLTLQALNHVRASGLRAWSHTEEEDSEPWSGHVVKNWEITGHHTVVWNLYSLEARGHKPLGLSGCPARCLHVS